jgi:alkylation response protein AidB-like acyl-CoA dehydrogenase
MNDLRPLKKGPRRENDTSRRLIERARELAPVVEAEALASEEAATLTPKCVSALRDSTLLSAFLPRELGGGECEAVVLVELVEEIARQDGSTGWCFGMNGIISGITSAGLSDSGVEEVFGERGTGQTLLAGGFPPQGRASRDGDGWRVSGHFRFGSGAPHADFMVCTTLELEGETPVKDGAIPAMRSFVVPREAVRLDDNWQVAGLQGTGSCDYHLDDHWVAEEMSFRSSPLVPRRGRSLYSIPLLSLAGAPHAGFALGVGKRALEEIALHAGWRQRLGSTACLAERPAFQQGFARARTRLRSARALVMEAYEALGAATRSEAGASLADRAEASAATTNAYEAALAAASFAFRAGGGAALYRSNRLQRCLRDIQAGAQHIVVSDESWERMGQLWLGVGEPQML